ncbi:MAG: hypothetical protein IT566_15915 [Rhodospirillaceae bacterium]|nr:hypothetical protein [Rhodospirillaceae bacterium]
MAGFLLGATAVHPFAGGVTAASASAEAPATGGESANVTRAELESFLKAKARTEEITAFWADSIRRSGAADVLRGVRAREIEIAVGLEGLSLDRYREIERMARQRGDVREALETLAR